MKFLLIGCGSILFLALVAAGVLGFLGYRAYQQHLAPVVHRMEESVKKLDFKVEMNSDKANGIARQVMTYRLPGGAKGISAVNLGGFKLAVLEGKSKANPVTLVLVSLPPQSGQQEWRDMHKFVLNELSPIVGTQNFTQEKAFHEERKLCGENVSVEVKEGSAREKNDEKIEAVTYQAQITRKGNQILAVIEATGNSRDSVAKNVFSSLSCP